MSTLVILAILLSTPWQFHYADEGVAAHLFQILIPLQVPIIAFFAIKWLPHDRRASLEVLALQCCLALTPLAIVYFLHV